TSPGRRPRRRRSGVDAGTPPAPSARAGGPARRRPIRRASGRIGATIPRPARPAPRQATSGGEGNRAGRLANPPSRPFVRRAIVLLQGCWRETAARHGDFYRGLPRTDPQRPYRLALRVSLGLPSVAGGLTGGTITVGTSSFFATALSDARSSSTSADHS